MYLFARKIIAWTLADTMEVYTVIKTIEKDKAIRNTDLPLIIHTDLGSQYVSQAWREANKNMQRSYSHKGYPYDNACIDSSVAIVVALFLVKEPVLQIIKNLKELVLFSPEQDVMDTIRKVVNKDIQNYDYSLDFLDVTQTGRKTWISVYVKSKNDIVKIKDFKRIQEHITKDLENNFDQISVEIVPAI